MNELRILKYLTALALATLLVACGGGGGGGGGGTTPTPTPTPQSTVLTGVLSGDQVVGTVATGGSGDFTVTVSADGSTIDYDINIAGTLNGDILQAHIHSGVIGANGPIMLWLCADPAVITPPNGIPTPPACSGQPPLTIAGTLTSADLDTGSFGGSFADAVQAISSQGAYINVHTQAHPGGEIRGQIGFNPTATTPPTATDPADDTFTWLGNTPLTIPAANGVLGNDPAAATIATSDTASANGGSVTLNADGGFNYTPVHAFKGTDSFTYTIAGSTRVALVTIQINAAAWYVDNTAAAGGNGNFASPFNTLAAAQTISAQGDTIFVFTGDGTDAGQNAGFDFLINQSLLGQGVAFTFPALPGVDIPIVAAGTAPAISRNGLANVAGLIFKANNTAAGLSITTAANEGVLVEAVGGYSIHDNIIANTAREGIRLLNVTGTGSVMNNSISATGREGIKLTNIENIGGGAATTDVNAVVTMSGNTIDDTTAAGNHAIAMDIGGTTTDVQVTVSGNTISNAGNDGINANIIDSATFTAHIDGNTVTASANEGIDLQGNNTSTLSAGVDGNDLSLNNSAIAQFRALTAATSSICLELTNNGPTTTAATFNLQNNGTGTFQIFESGNDNLANRPAGDIFVDVLQGACGLP